jgi:hypothetical protein
MCLGYINRPPKISNTKVNTILEIESLSENTIRRYNVTFPMWKYVGYIFTVSLTSFLIFWYLAYWHCDTVNSSADVRGCYNIRRLMDQRGYGF